MSDGVSGVGERGGFYYSGCVFYNCVCMSELIYDGNGHGNVCAHYNELPVGNNKNHLCAPDNGDDKSHLYNNALQLYKV